MLDFLVPVLNFIRRQVGLRTDAADASGSLHAKVTDVKAGITSILAASNIKSIQRGTVVIALNTTSATATISAVTTSKAMVNILGYTGGFQTTDDPGVYLGRIALTNSTTVTAIREASGVALTISYEVIEIN